jgi:oligogalacturonide lyase
MKGPDGKPLTFAEQKEVRLNQRLEQRIPMAIFTVNTATGEIKVIHRATDWLNHLRFSPTDPQQIMYGDRRSRVLQRRRSSHLV